MSADFLSKQKKSGRGFDYGKAGIYFVLLLFCVITLAPFIWMILTSFKSQIEAVSIPPSILPRIWRLDAYFSLPERMPFLQMYFNTIVSAIATVAGQLIFCSLAGYAFGRLKFPGRDFLFVLCLSILMIPTAFFILPQLMIIQSLNLSNTLTALYLPNLFSAFGTFLMRQFFMNLPKELEESAKVDGCSHGRIFLFIMLPLIRPALVSLGILTLRFSWNNLLWPLIVNSSPRMMPLTVGLSYLQGQFFNDFPAIMAGAVLSVIPLVVIFAIFQKQFIQGIAFSGLKA